MKNLLLHSRWNHLRIGHRVEGGRHHDLRAEMLFIVFKSLFAVACKVHVRRNFHRLGFPFGELEFRSRLRVYSERTSERPEIAVFLTAIGLGVQSTSRRHAPPAQFFTARALWPASHNRPLVLKWQSQWRPWNEQPARICEGFGTCGNRMYFAPEYCEGRGARGWGLCRGP